MNGINDFNSHRKNLLKCSNHLCFDEMMSTWRPRTSKTGGLPNITYIIRKPEPLGTEFKCATCSKSSVMMFLELQRGKDGMKSAQHNNQIGL